jgi:hypothetical protein
VNEHRISAQEAGYLELPGAVKDADCEVVEVDGGVSSERGCCNSFGWKSQNVERFACGECKYLEGQGERADQPDETKPLGTKEARGMSFKEILESERPAEGKQ